MFKKLLRLIKKNKIAPNEDSENKDVVLLKKAFPTYQIRELFNTIEIETDEVYLRISKSDFSVQRVQRFENRRITKGHVSTLYNNVALVIGHINSGYISGDTDGFQFWRNLRPNYGVSKNQISARKFELIRHN